MKKSRLMGIAFLMMGSVGAAAAMTAMVPPSESRFEKERLDIRADLSKAESHSDNLAAWKEELKADRKADLKGDVIVDKKEIAKAKADVVRDRKYLKADKKDLERDYALAVKEQKKAARESRSDLHEAKQDVRADLRSNNDIAIKSDAAEVAVLIRQANREEAAVADLTSDFKAERATVREEIRQSKARSKGKDYNSTAFAE